MNKDYKVSTEAQIINNHIVYRLEKKEEKKLPIQYKDPENKVKLCRLS